MHPPDELAVYLPMATVSPPENPYGRLIANAGTYRALARYGGLQRMHFQSRNPPPPEQLAAELAITGPNPQVTTGPVMSTAAASRAGVQLSGQPYLTEPLWVRRHDGKDRDYSIVGTIFAFASAPHREQMLQAALAPLHDWDALICSSPTLRQTVAATLDTWEDHLRERFGVADLALPRPQLPVIPFGSDVHRTAEQAADTQARLRLRGALGISEDTVMVYYLGRLSYYDKAFPQAMFRAVRAAADATGVPVHFVMTGWFPGGDEDRDRYEQAALTHAPGVPVTFLDGNDAQVVAECWAAADVFFQLSDTILETFGQALVEAMSAGLPLVVSDWDGFRCIVRDGEDGFLVPTLGAPPGPLGEALALLESLGVSNYPHYVGTVAAHTAVNVQAAAESLGELLVSPELRHRMGDNGRRRAFEAFAWPVVTGQYLDLFAELAGRRAAGTDSGSHRMNPLRSDPFADFAMLPSAVLDDDTVVGLTGLRAPAPGVELDQLFGGVRTTPEEAATILRLLDEGPATVREVTGQFPARRRPLVRMTLMWLAKAGSVDWRQGG